MIYTFKSLMDSVVGWYGPKNVTTDTLNRAWTPRAISKVAGRETPSGAISVEASAREEVAALPAMT